MKRVKQFDMFDVAKGNCSLDEYLFQRYSENDLSSNFWIDEKDEVDELRAPKPQADGLPGVEPEVIPIRGPRAQAKPSVLPEPPEGLEKDQPQAQHSSPQELASDGQELYHRQEVKAESLESFQAQGEVELASAENFSNQDLSNPPGSLADENTASPEKPSMEDLLAKFHQARKDYQERTQDSETLE